MLIGLTFGGFFARYWWRFEQASHFCVQYLWLLTPLAGVLWLARCWRLAAVATAATLVNLSLVAPIYWPAAPPPVEGESLRLISFNVLAENRRHADVLEFLRGQQAEIVLLMEVDSTWSSKLADLSDIYPHRHVIPREDHFGIALLSRIPLEDVQTMEFGTAGLPSVVAKFSRSGREVLLLGTHPLPPGTAQMAAERNEQLQEIAEYVRQQKAAVILAGDLNVTSYSPYFTDLLDDTNLRDSRQGFGVQASWAPRLPILQIPIDHCLVSPEIGVLDRRIGPDLGSDHRPVLVELRISGKADVLETDQVP